MAKTDKEIEQEVAAEVAAQDAEIERQVRKELEANASYSKGPAIGDTPNGRFFAKNFGVEGNTANIKKYYEQQNPDMDFAVKGNDLYFKKKGEDTYHPIDVDNFSLDGISRYADDPMELVRDYTDVVADLGKGTIDNAGGLAAGLGWGTLGARLAIGAGTEAIRQGIGQVGGIENNMSTDQMIMSGSINGLVPTIKPAYHAAKSGLITAAERLGDYDEGALRYLKENLPTIRSNEYTDWLKSKLDEYIAGTKAGFDAYGKEMIKHVKDELPVQHIKDYITSKMNNYEGDSLVRKGYASILGDVPKGVSPYRTVEEATGRMISRPLPPVQPPPKITQFKGQPAFEYPSGNTVKQYVGKSGIGHLEDVPEMLTKDALPPRMIYQELPMIQAYENSPEIISKRVLRNPTGTNGMVYGPETIDEPVIGKLDMLNYKNDMFRRGVQGPDFGYRDASRDVSKYIRKTLMESNKGMNDAEKKAFEAAYDDGADKFSYFAEDLGNNTANKMLTSENPNKMSTTFNKWANPKDYTVEASDRKFQNDLQALAEKGGLLLDPVGDTRVNTGFKYFKEPTWLPKFTPAERMASSILAPAAYMATDSNRLAAAVAAAAAAPVGKMLLSPKMAIKYVDSALPKQRFLEKGAEWTGKVLNSSNSSSYKPAMGSTMYNLYRDPNQGYVKRDEE